jgi:hypothetical protein
MCIGGMWVGGALTVQRVFRVNGSCKTSERHGGRLAVVASSVATSRGGGGAAGVFWTLFLCGYVQ